MMKKALAVFLAGILMMSAFSCVLAEDAGFTVKSTPVVQGSEQAGTMDLRFYAEAPHVAYYGIKAYLVFMRQEELTVTAQDGGFWEIRNPNGSVLQVNPAAGTITAPDWALFQNPSAPYRTQIGVKDSPCAWTYYSELVFDDPPAAVVFNFARYGIRIYADAEDVYLPLGLLSTMFTDVAVNYVSYNGETVFRPVIEVETITSMPQGFYEGKRISALLDGTEKRAEDEIRESYGELCFILDYFFGHPGIAALDQAIAEKGLHAALQETEGGEKLLKKLLSPDMGDYLAGLTELFFDRMDDGHTAYTGISGIMNDPLHYPLLVMKVALEAGPALAGNSSVSRGLLQTGVQACRSAAWGDELYREFGSTAIIRIDSFNPDIRGWEAYYAGQGEIPMDAFGITWTGLKRASENPAIQNVLLDLTVNMGGSGDILMAMADLLTGDNVFRGYNVLTGQHQHAVVHTDKNLDGVFDEKDDEVRYDFHYGVLTTRVSFSCGNLFPFLMQDQGAVLLGEPSGGGSCCVQFAAMSDGTVFVMSSYMWALRNRNDDSLESGCRPDLPISRVEPPVPTNANPRFSMGDYTPYYDGGMLDRMMNDWFAQAETPAA